MERNDCGLNPTIIQVSAVSLSLLLIVILTIIIIAQCLLMVRMRKSKNVVRRKETYTEATNPTSMQCDVPITTNEAYILHKIAFTSTEPEYAIVK